MAAAGELAAVSRIFAGAKVTKVADTTFTIENGCELTDGPYRTVVEYSDEDAVWYARTFGITCSDEVIGDGQTREAALMCLTHALASLVDSFKVYGPPDPAA